VWHQGEKEDRIMQAQLCSSLVPIFKGFSHGTSNRGEKFVIGPGQRTAVRLYTGTTMTKWVVFAEIYFLPKL